MNQTYVVYWTRGKSGPDGWSITGHWMPFVNGKAQPGGKMVLSQGSKILADGRLSVKMRTFGDKPIVSTQSVLQTRTGKWYHRFYKLYAELRGDASKLDAFTKFGGKRIAATRSALKLADFIRDFGAQKIAAGGDALAGWIRRHIFALTNQRAYGKAKSGKLMATAVEIAAREAGLDTSSPLKTFRSIEKALRAEEKNGFKELRRYETRKDPKTGKIKRVLVNTGYTRASVQLAAFLSKLGPVTLHNMAKTDQGQKILAGVHKLIALKKMGGYVAHAVRAGGLEVQRGRKLPEVQPNGYYSYRDIMLEAHRAVPGNVDNGIYNANYDHWARTGRRIMTREEAGRAADAWRADFEQNLNAHARDIGRFLGRPGIMTREGFWNRPALNDAIANYLRQPRGTPEHRAAFAVLLRIGVQNGFNGRNYGMVFSTLPSLVDLIAFGEVGIGIAGARDRFVGALDQNRRANAEAANLVAWAMGRANYWHILQILLGVGLWKVKNGRFP